MDPGAREPDERMAKVLYPLGLGLLAAFTARALSTGLAPPSLWLDDLWPVVLTEQADLNQLFTFSAPVSPFFLLLLRVVHGMLPDRDLAYQVVPFAATVIGGPLLAAAGARASGSRWAGIAAAALYASNPVLLTYSVRVKQFSLDALAVTLLLLLAFSAKGEQRTGRLFMTSAVLAPLSFTSIFLSVPLCIVRLIRERTRRVAVFLGIFLAVVLATYSVLMAPRSNEALRSFWQDYYLPLDPGLFSSFIGTHAAALFANAFPEGLGVLGFLIVPGLWGLIRTRRDVAIAAGTMYLLVLGASAMGRYPVGTGRTEIFTFPVTILLSIHGARVLTRQRRGMIALVAAGCVAIFLIRTATEQIGYVVANDRQVVELANEYVEQDDGLVIYPFSSWSVAHYGVWPVELIPSDDVAHGFYANPLRDKTLLLRTESVGIEFRRERGVLEGQLEPFLRNGPKRIWLIATATDPVPNQWIVEIFRQHGYVVEKATRVRGAGFASFVRREN